MAYKEPRCTDNYTLPKGDKGPKGPQGDTGIQGLAGPGIQGPTGTAGGNKIDINLQSNDNPYIDLVGIIPGNVVPDLGFFVFPGTNEFTPSSWRVAYSLQGSTGTLTAPATIFVELGFIQTDGTKQAVASFTDTQQSTTAVYTIKEISSFSNLPPDPALFYISGSAGGTTGSGKTVVRIYATELRE